MGSISYKLRRHIIILGRKHNFTVKETIILIETLKELPPGKIKGIRRICEIKSAGLYIGGVIELICKTKEKEGKLDEYLFKNRHKIVQAVECLMGSVSYYYRENGDITDDRHLEEYHCMKSIFDIIKDILMEKTGLSNLLLNLPKASMN